MLLRSESKWHREMALVSPALCRATISLYRVLVVVESQSETLIRSSDHGSAHTSPCPGSGSGVSHVRMTKGKEEPLHFQTSVFSLYLWTEMLSLWLSQVCTARQHSSRGRAWDGWLAFPFSNGRQKGQGHFSDPPAAGVEASWPQVLLPPLIVPGPSLVCACTHSWRNPQENTLHNKNKTKQNTEAQCKTMIALVLNDKIQIYVKLLTGQSHGSCVRIKVLI